MQRELVTLKLIADLCPYYSSLNIVINKFWNQAITSCKDLYYTDCSNEFFDDHVADHNLFDEYVLNNSGNISPHHSFYIQDTLSSIHLMFSTSSIPYQET